MFYTRRFQKYWHQRWLAFRIRAEIFAWRQIIALSRNARAARLWLQPIGLGLLALPTAFVLGFVVSFLS